VQVGGFFPPLLMQPIDSVEYDNNFFFFLKNFLQWLRFVLCLECMMGMQNIIFFSLNV
jgi:hypothetical protein